MKEVSQTKTVEFQKIHGFGQPSFLLISPTKACNLRCIGCYADSDANIQSLDWDILEKTVSQANDLWGVQFIVISGGEPLVYRSKGKSILDLAENHPDILFMFYTNSTLMTEEIVQRLADLGNIIPMISLKAGRKDRCKTRKGVFER